MITPPRLSFTRTAAERSVRPARVERFGFGDLLQSHLKRRKRTGREGDLIVPVEAARAGDKQVLAAADAHSPNPPGPPVALDVLAKVPTVESVVASTEVTLRTRLPSVTELLFVETAPLVPEPEFFAQLPNLHTLHAMTIWHTRKLMLSSLAGLGIRELAVVWDRLEPGAVQELGAFSELHRLALRAGPGNTVEWVSRLRKLEYLWLDGGRSGWKHLTGLDRLEELVLWDARLSDLHCLDGCVGLRSLWLRGRRVKSLDGIGGIPALESAWLEVLGIPDLAPLEGLQSLHTLELSGLALDDLRPLSGLPSLRSLTLAAADGGWRVKSLAPLSGLDQLEVVRLRGARIGDRDLTPLRRLRNLKRIELFPSGYLGDKLAAFRKARPDVTIEAQDDAAEATVSIGPVEIHPPSREIGDWWFLQDLTAALGTDTNTEAEARLQHMIGRRSHDLLARLRFDSEAGAVGVAADSEADIREVAELIAELAESR
jgi:hypothetical protein